MKVSKFKIAGGNRTALVYSFKGSSNDKRKITKKLLQEVEQVGFILSESRIPKMEMMGGELCINATIAFASTLGSEGFLLTSGLKKRVKYKNFRGKTEISIFLDFDKKDNIILFEGIGFIIFEKKDKKKVIRKELEKLAKNYHLQAFGAIIFENKDITPYVYVSDSNSFVKETACGSGSIAFSIITGITRIIQPSKESIFVSLDKRKVRVSATVTSL